MKAIIDLLYNCKEKGVFLAVDVSGEQLKAQGKVSQLSDVEKELIKTHKQQIISFLSNDKQYERIPQAKKSDSYRLSAAQKRLWVVSQHKAASVAYNVPLALTLRGSLDVQALQQAFDHVIVRHESLRTVFQEKEGEVYQIIREVGEVKFNLEFTSLPEEKYNAEKLHECIRHDFESHFDLENGPLIKGCLYQRTPQEWVFTLVIHHIISDGWSMQVLVKELMMYYESLKVGQMPSLVPLGIHYKDYASWQEGQFEHKVLAPQKAYWMDQFEGEIPVLEFPTDYARPAIKTYEGSSTSVVVPQGLVQQLQVLCQENGGTLFMGLLAAVNVVLYRYTGQEDLVVGSPVAGRQHTDLDGQIGFYVNTLALRNRFDGEKGYLALLEIVKANTLAAYQHQDYPFDELVRALPQVRDASRNPLFDVWVVLHNESEVSFADNPLTNLQVATYRGVAEQRSRRDLTFNFVENEGEIILSLGFNTSLYTLQTATQLANHFVHILQAVVQKPSKAIGELDYLTAREKNELLAEFNKHSSGLPADSMHFVGRFEACVMKSPEAIALVHGEVSLTYRELNEKANRVAHYLRETYEVRANDIVGVQLERGEWMGIVVLGILKSGAAYLPMEVEYPADRVAYIVDNSQCNVVMDAKEIARFEEVQQDYGVHNPAVAHDLSDLAYVIYTSGSTGNPKGVMISHRALADYIDGILEKTNLQDCQSFGLVSTMAADLGNTMVYVAWSIGGELHMFSKEEVMNPKVMGMTQIDSVKITPSHWKALQVGHEHFVPKKCLVFGGEQLTEDVLHLLSQYDAPGAIYNHYGPSETTIGKLIQPIDLRHPRIALGTPIGRNQVYVLDNRQQLVPKGVIGEIYISGVGISNGYLGNPQLVDRKFIPNPFAPGDLMYKTGDLGRILPGLVIEFLGRRDDQVKIRGYRVELGEIEYALCQNNEIKAAVVLAKPIETDMKLVAFVEAGQSLDVAVLKEYLESKLPSYMVPGYYVVLDKMPINANGKVDKKALTIPDLLQQTEKEAGLVIAENKTQQKLVAIWAEALGVDAQKVGIKDNFFDLGGHSLNAIKVVFKINEHFNTDLDLSILFDEPTVEGLSVEIENTRWLQEGSSGPDVSKTVI